VLFSLFYGFFFNELWEVHAGNCKVVRHSWQVFSVEFF